MATYVIRMTHGEFLTAGEVVKETPSGYSVKGIEGCHFSHVGGRFPKDEVVFVSDDKAKVVRLMAFYLVLWRQHGAVIDAANKAYRESLAAITGRDPRSGA